MKGQSDSHSHPLFIEMSHKLLAPHQWMKENHHLKYLSHQNQLDVDASLRLLYAWRASRVTIYVLARRGTTKSATSYTQVSSKKLVKQHDCAAPWITIQVECTKLCSKSPLKWRPAKRWVFRVHSTNRHRCLLGQDNFEISPKDVPLILHVQLEPQPAQILQQAPLNPLYLNQHQISVDRIWISDS
jgi:hypothetical protein